MTTRTELLKAVLEGYQEEHKDLVETWKTVESKAQGTVAVAGVFLAACFAWAREADQIKDEWQLVGLVVAVILLVGSVVAALASLKIKDLPRGILGDGLSKLVIDFLSLSDANELGEREEVLYRDSIRLWSENNQSMRSTINRKATCLARSQLLAVSAAVVVACVTCKALMEAFP